MGTSDDRLAHLALSQLIARQRGKRAHTYPLTTVLRGTSSTPLEPVGSRGGWPSGKTALGKLGMTARQLDELAATCEASRQPLPREVVEAFFPRPLWPIVNAFIASGPAGTWNTLEPYLRQRATIGGGSPRCGVLSSASINTLLAAYRAFAMVLDDLRRRRDSLDLDDGELADLRRWRKEDLPARVDATALGARPAERDRRAPPARLVRLLILGMTWEIERRRTTNRGLRGIRLLLRDRALLGVAATLGPRRSVLESLTPASLLNPHIFPSGLTGPALVFYPGKTLHADVARVKGIPDELHQWIVEWIDFAGLGTDDRLFRGLTERFPKMLTRAHDRADDPNPYYRLVREHFPRALYSAHTLRHLAEQLACQVGNDWLTDHRETLMVNGQGLPAERDSFSRVLLDHEFGSVSARYQDIGSPQGREHWSHVTATGVWDYLLGDHGASRGIDTEQLARCDADLQRAREHRDATVADLEQTEATLLQGVSGMDPTEAIVHAHQLSVRIGALARKLSAAERDVSEAEHRRELAATTLVPLDDLQVPQGPASTDPTDLGEPETELPVLRDYAWPKEYRWAVGENVLAESTLRRWMAGELPFTPGDRRRQFEPSDIEVISPKRRRLRLDTLDWSRFTPHIQERLEIIRRTPDPHSSRSVQADGDSLNESASAQRSTSN